MCTYMTCTSTIGMYVHVCMSVTPDNKQAPRTSSRDNEKVRKINDNEKKKKRSEDRQRVVVLYVHPPLLEDNSAPPAGGHVRALTRVILVAPCRWPENPGCLAVSSRAKLNAAVLGAQATSPMMIFFV